MTPNRMFLNSCRIASLVVLGSISMQPLFAEFPYTQQVPHFNHVPVKKSYKTGFWSSLKQRIKNYYESLKNQIEENGEFLRGAGTVLMGFAIYKIGLNLLDWLYPAPMRGPYRVRFDHRVQLGDSQVNANIRTFGDEVTIRQIESPVQYGHMCGYHALYNTTALARAHQNPQENIAEFLEPNRCYQQIDQWIAQVMANQIFRPDLPNRPGSGAYAADGSSIRSTVVEHLLAQERQRDGGILHGINDENVSIHVIEGGVAHLHGMFLEDPVRDRNGVINMVVREADEVNRILAAQLSIFLIPTGVQMYGAADNSTDHWIIVALERHNDGRRTYTVMDSLGSSNHFNQHQPYARISREVINILEARIFQAPIIPDAMLQQPARNRQQPPAATEVPKAGTQQTSDASNK